MPAQDTIGTATTNGHVADHDVKVTVGRVGDDITIYMDDADDGEVTTAYLFLSLDAARNLLSDLRSHLR